jgi:hypothetical protein
MNADKSPLLVSIDIDGFQSEEVLISRLEDIDGKMQSFFEAYNISNPITKAKIKARILMAFKNSQKRTPLKEIAQTNQEEKVQKLDSLKQLKRIMTLTSSNFFRGSGLTALSNSYRSSNHRTSRSPETQHHKQSTHQLSARVKVPEKAGLKNKQKEKSTTHSARTIDSRSSVTKPSSEYYLFGIKSLNKKSQSKFCETQININQKTTEKSPDKTTANLNFQTNLEPSQKNDSTKHEKRVSSRHINISPDKQSKYVEPNTRSPSKKSKSPYKELSSPNKSVSSFQTKKNSNMQYPLWTYHISNPNNVSDIQQVSDIHTQPSNEDASLLREDLLLTKANGCKVHTETISVKEKLLLSNYNPLPTKKIADTGISNFMEKKIEVLFTLLDDRNMGYLSQKTISLKKLTAEDLGFLEPVFLEIYTNSTLIQYTFQEFRSMCVKLCV